MYSAAIGSNYDIDQLLDAASDDCSVFRVGKMNDVLSLIKGVAKQSCKGNMFTNQTNSCNYSTNRWLMEILNTSSSMQPRAVARSRISSVAAELRFSD